MKRPNNTIKTFNQQKSISKVDPPKSPMPTPSNDIHAMEIEEKKESVDVDTILEGSSVNGKKANVDLDDEDKKKKKDEKDNIFDNCTIIRDVKLSGDIHVRLLSTIDGYFVDLRKYFRGVPSKKGIMMLASKFVVAADILKKDIEEVIPSIKDLSK